MLHQMRGLPAIGCLLSLGFFSIADAQNYSMQTIAGRTLVTEGGAAVNSFLRYPIAVAVDSSGNTYIADQNDNRVWKVDSTGVITTFAGDGFAYFSGDKGPANKASLDAPSALAVDSTNNVYICDSGNYRVRMVTPAGVITTVAGNGTATSSGDGLAATKAGVIPVALAVDKSGDIFISEGPKIREVSYATGIITTIAGTGTPGYSGDNGPATNAKLYNVTGLAVDSSGVLYLADYWANVIRKIAVSGTITTIGGTGTFGYSGDGSTATKANMDPYGLALDPSGTGLYLTEPLASTIRRIDFTTGNISIVGGQAGYIGFSGDGATAFSAVFYGPFGVAVDAAKNIYVCDTFNQRIRKILSSTGAVATMAGTSVHDGVATNAYFNHPEGLFLNPKATLDIADSGNNLVRQLNLSGGTTSSLPPYYAFFPEGVAEDSTGNVYASSFGNDLTYVLKYAGSQVAYFAGNGTSGFSGDNGQATKAELGEVTSIAVDTTGNFYLADDGNARIRRIDTTGSITTIAGTGAQGAMGDGGPATKAGMDPYDIAIDKTGAIYVADTSNNVIRKFTPGGSITTVAGTGAEGFSGDGGPATKAMLDFPTGVAVDSAGNLYICDNLNSVVRKVTTDGVIHTIAGDGYFYPFSGDGAALKQNLDPYRITVDASGNLYVADWANDRIRKLVPVNATTLTVVSGDKQSGPAGTTLSQKLIVTVTGSDGNPYPGAAVTFATTSGATLTPATAITGNDGTASTSVKLPATPGTVTVTATVAGLPVVTFTLTATAVVVTPASLSIAGGNGQTGVAGTALAQNLVVTVVGSDGNPFAGATVSFAVSSGSATLNPTSAVSGANGTASTSVTLGAAAGTVSITATVTGLTAVTFTETATAAPILPQIFIGGVVSAGLSQPTIQAASPNAILSIFGQNFAPAGTSRKVAGNDLVNGLVPTNLIGVCVTFGTQRAPIFLVTPGQLNVQAPQLAASGTVAVQVITNCDTPLQAVSNTVQVAVQAAAPEFFYSANAANGSNPIAAVDGVTQGGVGDPARLGAGFALAYPGEILQIYATGFGLTNPAFTPGQLPPTGAQVSGMTVSIDGTALAASAISYAGVAPMNAGLYQLNLTLPAGLAPGDHKIVMTVNGASSSPGAYVSVGAAQGQ
jgi:uncharacterized protein (TIGR03437 family)